MSTCVVVGYHTTYRYRPVPLHCAQLMYLPPPIKPTSAIRFPTCSSQRKNQTQRCDWRQIRRGTVRGGVGILVGTVADGVEGGIALDEAKVYVKLVGRGGVGIAPQVQLHKPHILRTPQIHVQPRRSARLSLTLQRRAPLIAVNSAGDPVVDLGRVRVDCS
eukprot:3933301-Rhodomonas_salina.1